MRNSSNILVKNQHRFLQHGVATYLKTVTVHKSDKNKAHKYVRNCLWIPNLKQKLKFISKKFQKNEDNLNEYRNKVEKMIILNEIEIFLRLQH